MWGIKRPQAHWALADELRGTEWMANAIFDVPNLAPLDPESQDQEPTDSRSLTGWGEDASCGQDDPKPGC